MHSEKTVLVADSGIHGLGLFAAQDIGPDETICEYRGERISREESRRRLTHRAPGTPVYTVTIDDDTELDGDIPDNPAKYANHGCAPNAVLTAVKNRPGLFLVATERIPKGREILFDYGFGLADSVAHPCHCGAKTCPGRIVAEHLRPLLRKMLQRPIRTR